MKFQRKKPYKRIALALSLCTVFVWAMLGTGASLAWFTDTSEEITNLFHVADFELAVSHRTDVGTWEPIDGKTDVFDKEALYEPGYVQVVYLKVENKGDRAFDFRTAVSVTKNNNPAINVFGRPFFLQDHLRFGIAAYDTFAEVERAMQTREAAAAIATEKLNNYTTDAAALAAGQTAFVALVVQMPASAGNEAHYRGDTVPQVELGIIVNATQQRS